MSPALYALMIEWLSSDDNTQRRHARHRLSQPDAASYEKPPGFVPIEPAIEPPPPRAPLASSLRAVRLGFRQCLYSSHEGCGCTGTKCFNRGRIVGLNDCIDCLGLNGHPAVPADTTGPG